MDHTQPIVPGLHRHPERSEGSRIDQLRM